jgi:hypothetical protein
MLLDLSLRGVYVATRASNVGRRGTGAIPGAGNVRGFDSGRRLGPEREDAPGPWSSPGFGVRFTKLEVEDVRLIARAIQSYCQSNPIYRRTRSAG